MSWGWSEIREVFLTLLQAAAARSGFILNPENSDGCGMGGELCVRRLKSWKKHVTLPDGWVIGDLPHLCGN